MNEIMKIAKKYNLLVIEDNAHGIFGEYHGKKLGSIGHISTFSFHKTKNVSCGEGGALAINKSGLSDRAEIIREKGTNRLKFLRARLTNILGLIKALVIYIRYTFSSTLSSTKNSKKFKKRKNYGKIITVDLKDWCR